MVSPKVIEMDSRASARGEPLTANRSTDASSVVSERAAELCASSLGASSTRRQRSHSGNDPFTCLRSPQWVRSASTDVTQWRSRLRRLR